MVSGRSNRDLEPGALGSNPRPITMAGERALVDLTTDFVEFDGLACFVSGSGVECAAQSVHTDLVGSIRLVALREVIR